MSSPSRKVGAKRVVKEFRYSKWAAVQDKFATVGETIAFHNLTMREQTLPLIRNEVNAGLARFDRYLHERRLLVRFWRWLTSFGHRPMTREQALEILAKYPRPEDEEKAEQPTATAEAEAEPAEPPQHRSCVVCGSVQFEPINERGGLRCDRGHIVEDPPLEVSATDPREGATAAAPAGEATGASTSDGAQGGSDEQQR